MSSHSQGSIVSTHLLASLIADGHIRPIVSSTSSKTCSVVCLALCGIHLGPLLYLNGSLTQVGSDLIISLRYLHSSPSLTLRTLSLQQLESYSSSRLAIMLVLLGNLLKRRFSDFFPSRQDTSSDVSQRYTKALSEILDYGVKMVYIASVDDQVVPVGLPRVYSCFVSYHRRSIQAHS